MKLYHNLERLQLDRPSIFTVGTFDGVHKGHQLIIKELTQRAQSESLLSGILTFEPHPQHVLNSKHGKKLKILTTIEEKLNRIARFNLDAVVIVPFTKEFAELNPESYIRDIIVKKLHVHQLVVGYDHSFGKDRFGNIDILANMGKKYGFKIEIIEPVLEDGTIVKSTQIRKLLQSGDVHRAAEFLGENFCITGKIIRGDGRGRKIGKPTANIQVNHPDKIIPADGVYAVECQILQDLYIGILNIGVRPTFEGKRHTIEVHILDFNKDVLGEEITIEFYQHIRDEIKFDNADELTAQVQRDKNKCLEYFAKKNMMSEKV